MDIYRSENCKREVFLDFFLFMYVFQHCFSCHHVIGCWDSGNGMTHLGLLAKLSILLVVNVSSGHHGIFEVKKRETREGILERHF
jgi:hypothetical protein